MMQSLIKAWVSVQPAPASTHPTSNEGTVMKWFIAARAAIFASSLAVSLAAFPVSAQEADATQKSAGSQQSAQRFKPEELEQIVAPIALYPDALLAQVFMAATYPLEIVQAARWSKEHPERQR